MVKEHPIHASAEVRWDEEVKIGKSMLPPNASSFAANARFKHSPEPEIFSIILYFRSEDLLYQNHLHIADLHFFAPEIVLPYLHIGSELFITEGPKIIGEARIISILSS